MVIFINDLPVELLIEIMQNLDKKTLKEVILACHWWKDVIECHFSWSINLNMALMSHIIVDLRDTNRKIRKLKLYKLYSHDSHSVVETFGRFESNENENGSLFFELLKCMPDLQYIDLCQVTIPEVSETCNLPDMDKLTTLKLHGCDDNILKSFRTLHLKSLTIEGNCDPSKTTSSHVLDFVRRQQNLTKLRPEGFEDKFFERLCQATPNGTMQCNLTQLILINFHPIYSSGLVNFFKMHSQTLQKLELEGNFPKEIYELIVGELKSVKFLKLKYILEDVDFGEALQNSKSIENLVLDYILISPLALRQLCKSMPNVKNLTLWDEWDAEKLHIICNTLQKVTKLFVHEFDYNFNEIKFANLTSLYIRTLVSDEVDWDAFTIANSKITEIIIFDLRNSVLNLEHIETITRNLKVQILRILSRISTNERFLSTIYKNSPDLKICDLFREINYFWCIYDHVTRMMG